MSEAPKFMHSGKFFFKTNSFQAVLKLDRLPFWKLESHSVKTHFYSVYKMKIVLLSQLQICAVSLYTTTFTSTTTDFFLFLSSPCSTPSWLRQEYN